MGREQNTPIFAWIATAALIHILWGEGAERVVRLLESRQAVARLAERVRAHVSRTHAPVEVALLDESTLPQRPNERSEQTQPPDETDPETATRSEDKPPEPRPAEPKAQPPKKTQPPKKDAAKPPEPKPEPGEKKKEEEKEKPLELPEVQMKRRVSVVQKVEDENQKDNPNARFLGKHANRVERETQARITSTDGSADNPTPGANHSGPTPTPGDAVVDDLAQSDENPGDPSKAPAESDVDGDNQHYEAKAGSPNPPKDLRQLSPLTPSDSPGAGTGNPARAASSEQTAQSAQQAREQAPDTIAGRDGAFSIGAHQQAQNARPERAARPRQQGRQNLAPSPKSRFGGLSTTPGGLNPNLNPLSALQAVGEEQLRRERVADGERRRSKHRGSWRTAGLERWRSAIENYVASVQPGNQTRLNTAHAPFADYLNRVHNRLHPIFAHGFLPTLDDLPSDHPMNRPDTKTDVEIVLSRDEGKLVRIGVTRASGSTMFDVSALQSIEQAAPFGAAPAEIVSPDGNVYLHWEFHRDPVYACATYFARPYILRVAPKPAPAPERPAPTPPQREHGSNSPAPAKGTPKEG